MSGVAEVRTAIATVIGPPADELLVSYFDPVGPFAGATFDALGSERSAPHQLTVDDLLATSLLDVPMPPRFVRAVLGDRGSEVTSLLRAVPADVDLWDASTDDLTAAEALWTWFQDFHDVGPVKAGKLLARKRPRLIPIVDRVVLETLPIPDGQVWTTLAEALRDEELRAAIDELRPPSVGEEITTLRLLDVAIWMRGSGSRNAKNAPSRAGLD